MTTGPISSNCVAERFGGSERPVAVGGSGYAAAGGVAGDNSAGTGTSDAAEQAYPDREEGDDDDLCDELFAVDFRRDLPQTPEGDIALATHPEMLRCNRNSVVGKRVSLMRLIDVARRLAKRILLTAGRDFQFEQRCAAGETFCVAAGI